jgi:hypothetical protein
MHSLSYFLTNLHAYDFEIWFQQFNLYHVVCDEQSLKGKARILIPFRDIYTDASRQTQTNFSQTIEKIIEKIIYEQVFTFLDTVFSCLDPLMKHSNSLFTDITSL